MAQTVQEHVPIEPAAPTPDEAVRARVDALLEEARAGVNENLPHALALAEEALALSVEAGYTRGRAYSLGYSGYAHYMLSDLATALQMLVESLGLLEEIGDVEGQAQVLGGLGSVHTSLGNYERALDCAHRALKIFRDTGNRQEEAWCLYGIGSGYLAVGDHEQALRYQQESLEIFEAAGDAVGRARALNGIGTVYQALGRYEEACSYHLRSLELFRAADNRMGEARALNDLGCICQTQGRADEAIRYHEASLELREQVGNRQAQSTSLINLGLSYLRQGDVARALDVLHQAREIAEIVGAKPRLYQAHEALAQAYEEAGDVAHAYEHFKAFHRIRDEVFSEEASVKLSNLHVSHEVEKARQEAEIFRLKNTALKEQNERLEQVLRELRAMQDQLLQSEKMASLGRLTAGIAHEIKNPLNFVNNFAQLAVELIDEIVEETEEAPDLPASAVHDRLDDLQVTAQKVVEHGRRADRIVQSMLLHARGSGGDRRVVDVAEMLREYVNLAYHGMRASVPGFNVTIEQDYEEELGEVALVPQEIGRVLLNLLNNAFYAVHVKKAAQNGYAPHVAVRARRAGASVEIRIEDNGPGIPAALKDRIFEPFFTTKPAGEGTGLGLSLSYDIVVQGHGGTMAVESDGSLGATFVLTLPAANGAQRRRPEDRRRRDAT